MTSLRRGMLACLIVAVPAVALPGVERTWAASPEQAELAERFLETASQLEKVSPQAAAALGDAAGRMFDNDPHLLRLAADLRLDLGQRDLAIKLLSALRQQMPDDQLSQVQSIDLISSKMESADAKAQYFERIVDNTNVPAEVRSHAALMLSGVQRQRGLDDEAKQAVDQALRLNPLNPKALQLRLDEVMRSGTAPQRARAMVDYLLANPLQPPVVSKLAEEHARAGVSDVAADLYGRLFDQLNASQQPASTDDSINYVLMLIQQGKIDSTAPIIQSLMKNDLSNPRVQYLNVLVAQQSGDANYVASQVAVARGVLILNLMRLQMQIDPNAPQVDDKTQPVLPDTNVAVSLLKVQKKPELKQQYLTALVDLAWLDVYFMGQPSFDMVIDAIKGLADPKDPVVNRIDGFTAISNGNYDLANVKLSAVAEHDPLSKLGLLSLQLRQGKDKAPILAEAKKLLAQFPVDVWSLMIRQSLQGAGKVDFRSPDADAIVAESNRLPRQWLEFQQTAAQSYLVDVDALTPTVTIGQPIWAKVTLQNTGNRTLLIGPGGVIDQYVPIDLTIRTTVEQPFLYAGIARLTGRLVLPPNTSTSAVVRLDNPAVDAFLASKPQFPMSIFSSAVINPTWRDAAFVPGLGGMRAQSRSVIERPAINFGSLAVRQQLLAGLNNPDPVIRLRSVMQVTAAASQMLMTADDQRQLAVDAMARVQKVADSDPSPTVRAIARQQLTLGADDAGQAKAIQAMLASPDAESRLIGCVMSINRAAAERAAWLKPLADDSDAVIQRLANAIIQLPDPSATQPSTQPATQPSGQPVK